MTNNLHQFINKNYKSVPLDENNGFKFTCAKQCWDTCCREQNAGLLQLSVYDVYSLLTIRPDIPVLDLIQVKIDEETNLPRAFIKWNSERVCPNLNNEDGTCSVYDHRPFACRIFPLEAKFLINDKTNSITVNYSAKENVCFGFHKEANPQMKKLSEFLDTSNYEDYLKFEKIEIFNRDKWIKKHPIKDLNTKKVHMLAQVLYCLKDKVTDKNTYFFDIYSEMLKIPKRLKEVEEFTPEELSTLALEELAPRFLEQFGNS